MANAALAVLESALRSRHLDRTLTTALAPLETPLETAPRDTRMETDGGALDACLRGGLPRGQLSEIAGPRSSGRTTLLMRMMAAATGRGEIVALVDPCDRLDVSSAEAAGLDLDRLLWIRGTDMPARRNPAPASRGEEPEARSAMDRTLKALNLVLQAGGFGIVAMDLGDVSPVELRRIPYSTWLRVQRAIEGSDTACVLLGPEPVARSAGGLTLALTGRSSWAGSSERSRRLTGAETRVQIHSPRRTFQGVVEISSASI
jgi:hypothetical protein